MLDVQEECLAEAPLLTVSGRFDGLGAEAFDRAAARLCPRPDLPLLLDLAGVDYVSSAGLRSVLRLAKTCWQQNTRLWLLALQPAVLHVFEMAGLLQQFDALANRADAVRRLHELGAAGARSTTVTLAGRQHTLHPRPAAESTLERWPATPAQPLTCLALDELGLAFGRAGLGNHAAAASAAAGPFVATENMVCVRSPETATAPPDFIISAHPADVPVYVAEAWRLSGTPAAFVAANEGTSSVADVLTAFPELLRLASGRLPAACAWIIAALEADGATDAGWVGVGCQPADGPWQMEAVHVRPLALSARPGELGAFLQTALRTETLVGAEVQQLAGGRQHAVPYLLALLRWTLPIVAFRQMPLLRKQAAAYAAALMTEALLEADPAAAAFLQPCTQAHDGARASQV